MREKNFLVHQHSNFLVCVSAPLRLSIFNLIEYVKIKNSFWSLAVFLNVLFNFFCFCKRSKWSPIYEFCRSSFFIFDLQKIYFEKILLEGDWGNPKKILDHQLKKISWWSRKIGHMLACGSARKRKKRTVHNSHFLFLNVSFFPEGMKMDHTVFSEASLKIHS